MDYRDLKTKKYTALGEFSWADVITATISEPGASQARRMVNTDGKPFFTLGGWIDTGSVQVLKNIDCNKVIYLTHEGIDDFFVEDILGIFDASGSLAFEMENLTNPESSRSIALNEADGVLCTRSAQIDLLKSYDDLITDGYQAPLVTTDPSLSQPDHDIGPVKSPLEKPCWLYRQD